MVWRWFLCTALSFTVIYLYTTFHCNVYITFQDMARKSNHFEEKKRLWEDKSINTHGRIMIPVHCPSTHCHVSITKFHLNPISCLKVICLTRCRADGHSRDYMLPLLGSIINKTPFNYQKETMQKKYRTANLFHNLYIMHCHNTTYYIHTYRGSYMSCHCI